MSKQTNPEDRNSRRSPAGRSGHDAGVAGDTSHNGAPECRAGSRPDPSRYTQSKKRVISVLRGRGPQTKMNLARLCGLGWATVVKAVQQLSADGVVHVLGTVLDESGDLRSASELYGLRTDGPLALGIDVEYRTTRIVLTNLAGEVLDQKSTLTPRETEREGLFEFFRALIEGFLQQSSSDRTQLAGIGIGIPGIGFPLPSRRASARIARELQADLERVFETSVRIGTNTHSYAVFEKWSSVTFQSGNFIFVSIRTGLGTGIFLDGELYTGMNGLAGEIGHMRLAGNDVPCRCGGHGCVETVVNQHSLLHQYRTHVAPNEDHVGSGGPATDPTVAAQLAELFTRAKRGNPAAGRVVADAGAHLGRALANSIIVLDLTNVLISGHFGPDGDALIPPVRDSIRRYVLPDVEADLRYMPFDPDGHTLGAALQVLKDFFVDIPTVHPQVGAPQ